MTSSHLNVRVPEPNKRPGVCYAVSDDGIELPIVDVTSPAFALTLSEGALGEFVSNFIRDERRSARVPRFLRQLLYRIFLRRSALAHGVISAHDTSDFLSGMSTYLLKLGPDNLGSYTRPIDRRIAAALPALALRLRLEDMARLLADGVERQLAHDSNAPLQLFNIGGGSALDSLNALILLRKKNEDLVLHRSIAVRVLDVDDAGPTFGAKALASLRQQGAPLSDVDVRFEHSRYDWKEPNQLASLLDVRAGAVVACSSEGALFEYGSDAEIIANLQALAKHMPGDAIVVGSVTRVDGAAPYMKSFIRIPTLARSLEAFSALVREAGFKIRRSVDRPFSHHVCLERIS